MNLDITPSCNIVDCLNDAAEILGLSYDVVETMAFKENIYPAGFEPFFDASDPDEIDTPLSNVIRQIMRKEGVAEMYLVEN
jgi:hypothetical protein